MEEINKIFQIGFNKCGTSSLYRLFEKMSMPRGHGIHWHEGRLAYTLQRNIQCGLPALSSYEGFRFFSDMECFYIDPTSNKLKLLFAHVEFFQILDRHYPGSKFILNTRSFDSWIASRVNHMVKWAPVRDGCVSELREWIPYDHMNMAAYGFSSREEVLKKWSDDWHRHHEAVFQHFAGRSKDLLVFDIERDPLAKLKDFFSPYGLVFAADVLPRDNQTLLAQDPSLGR